MHAPHSSRRRTSFSLFSALLLMTVAALSIGMWRNGREIVPLRREVARLRAEVGYLRLRDRTRIHLRHETSVAGNVWRWRIYLPPRRRYDFHCYHGKIADPGSSSPADWIAAIRAGAASPVFRSYQLSEDDDDDEEFTFDVYLTELDQQWWMRIGKPGKLGPAVGFRPSDNWLADNRLWIRSGSYQYDVVQDFPGDEPLVLLHLERGELSDDGENWSVRAGGKTTDRLVLWIEPQLPPPPAAAAAAPALRPSGPPATPTP